MNNQNTGIKPEALKGKLHGNCNRTDCQRPGAEYYNHSTKKYYCAACASTINRYNHTDSMQLFGHELCLHFSVLKGYEDGK